MSALFNTIVFLLSLLQFIIGTDSQEFHYQQMDHSIGEKLYTDGIIIAGSILSCLLCICILVIACFFGYVTTSYIKCSKITESKRVIHHYDIEQEQEHEIQQE
eukprot:215160_1